MCVCVCVPWLTMVGGTGLPLLLEEEEEEVGAAEDAGTGETSCVIPLLSRTLESKTRRSVSNCFLLHYSVG